MNENKKREELIIDNYYLERDKHNNQHQQAREGHHDISSSLNNSSDLDEQDRLFKNKLEESLSYMDSLKDMDYEFDINFLNIIDEAEKIQYARKGYYEALKFILCCLGIILSAILITVFLQTKVLFYIQLAAASIVPLALIPLASFYKSKGGNA